LNYAYEIGGMRLLEHSDPESIAVLKLHSSRKISAIIKSRMDRVFQACRSLKITDKSSLSNLSICQPTPKIAPLPDVQKPRHHTGGEARGSKIRQLKKRSYALQKSSKIGKFCHIP
jgi:hypothetical protein